MIGQSLAHFNITAKLGEGGMGQVYRAEDTRLGRQVAIKVLPEAFLAEPDRMARFEREAKLLAQLNHPNVAAIYDLAEADGVHFLVLELVEGEDLAERLARGRIPVEEALPIAAQIAEALEIAHEQGIVHRDLKPANIKVTADGQVKVLDFGLAKAWEADSENPALSQSPTLTAQMTRAGVILGTAAYMSPEQARGKTVDRRSDIWSLGVVLLEMLTARATFPGETVSDVMAAVLRQEIDFDRLPPETPGQVRRLLARCLVRDPKQRLQSAGDARLALREAIENPELAIGVAGTPAKASKLGWLVAAMFAISTLVLALVLGLGGEPEAAPVMRTSILPPEDSEFDFLAIAGPPKISRDGSKIAFVALTEGVRRIYVRALESVEPSAVPGTEGGLHPFWSPDASQLGFFANGELRRVSLTGGAAITLAAAEEPRGGSWSDTGWIIYSPSYEGPVYKIPAAGGTPEAVTLMADGEVAQRTNRYASFLPDDHHFLYLSRASGLPPSIHLGSLDGDLERKLLDGVLNAQFASGYVLYVLEGTLFARPFDLDTMEFRGPARIVTDPVTLDRRYSLAVFTASANGILVHQAVGDSPTSKLLLKDRTGQDLRIIDEGAKIESAQVSPDGSRVAFEITDSNTGLNDIWVKDIGGGVRSRFTFDNRDNYQPVWSPDGKQIAFGKTVGSVWTLHVKDSDGATPERLLADSDINMTPTSWSSDGRYLLADAYGGTPHEGEGDLWLFDFDDPAGLTRYRITPATEIQGAFSPDGRWIAWAGDDSGSFSIYAGAFPDTGGTWQIAGEGAMEPIWSADGKKLYFIQGGRLMAASIEAGEGSIQVTGVEEVFTTGWANVLGRRYSLMPDGTFVLPSYSQGTGTEPLTVTTNWPATLE